MKKVEAIIRLEKFEDVKNAVDALGCCPGISVERIEGQGKQKGATHQFRGREYRVELLPKMMLTLVVKDGDVEPVVKAIIDAAKTGEVGDGKIFVSPVDQVYRIRTGESGDVAV
jgi:nitrogen regulatory protein PII